MWQNKFQRFTSSSPLMEIPNFRLVNGMSSTAAWRELIERKIESFSTMLNGGERSLILATSFPALIRCLSIAMLVYRTFTQHKHFLSHKEIYVVQATMYACERRPNKLRSSLKWVRLGKRVVCVQRWHQSVWVSCLCTLHISLFIVRLSFNCICCGLFCF